jgi:hypothetical protein
MASSSADRLRIVGTSLIFVQRAMDLKWSRVHHESPRSFFGFGKHPADSRCFKSLSAIRSRREALLEKRSRGSHCSLALQYPRHPPSLPGERLPQPQFRNLHSPLPRIHAVIRGDLMEHRRGRLRNRSHDARCNRARARAATWINRAPSCVRMMIYARCRLREVTVTYDQDGESGNGESLRSSSLNFASRFASDHPVATIDHLIRARWSRFLQRNRENTNSIVCWENKNGQGHHRLRRCLRRVQ